jgi:hypothetical protein
MSRVHFELSWDGKRCSLRDLGSAKGTELDGEPVTEAEVPHGAWIRAGETDFSLHFEAHTPPPRDEDDEEGAPRPDFTVSRALEELQGSWNDGSLFALLDAARSERIQVLLREAVDEHRSLYEGLTAETMANVAPYLVELRKDSGLLERLVREGWGDAWGVFVVSKRSLRDLRAHFRRLLMAKREPDDDTVYFRFYDPRVLRVFVPTISVRQEDELFGEIDRFVCEGEAREVLHFARSRARGGEG